MNKDSDVMQAILLKLLFEADREDGPPLGDDRMGSSPVSGVTPLETESSLADSHGADRKFLCSPGDHPVMKTHFEALLKRRLTQEISQHPPLFPWEQSLQDYPDHVRSESSVAALWVDHLKTLALPMDVPEDVLVELFSYCQRVVSHTVQLGRQLVEAVETLFPDQPQTLAYVAGLVARPSTRSVTTETMGLVDYDTASTQQQIALTMLAAKSIFEALSLTVSPLMPSAVRTWNTAAGPLKVTAACLDDTILEVRADLPEPGTLVLTGITDTLRSERSTPGELILHLTYPQPQTPYTLEVHLGEIATPLRFQIKLDA